MYKREKDVRCTKRINQTNRRLQEMKKKTQCKMHKRETKTQRKRAIIMMGAKFKCVPISIYIAGNEEKYTMKDAHCTEGRNRHSGRELLSEVCWKTLEL